MGLRDKAQVYRESLKQDIIDNLEDYYEGQVLTRSELLEIKESFNNKLIQVRQDLEHNLILIQNILDFGKSLQNSEKLAEFYHDLVKGLVDAFGVRQALFLEWNEIEGYRIIRQIGLGDDTIGIPIELTLQEEESLNGGRANYFSNNFAFRKIAPEIGEYLLVPVSKSGTRLGVLAVFSMDSSFPLKETEYIQVFEWISTAIACPYTYILDKEKGSDPYNNVLKLIRKGIDAALFAGDILSLVMIHFRNQKKFCELHGIQSYLDNMSEFIGKLYSWLPKEGKAVRCAVDQILLLLPGFSKPECDTLVREILEKGAKSFQKEQEMDIGLDSLSAVYPLDAEEPEEYLALLNI